MRRESCLEGTGRGKGGASSAIPPGVKRPSMESTARVCCIILAAFVFLSRRLRRRVATPVLYGEGSL